MSTTGRLGPGSPAPRHRGEVEALLRMVPRVAFLAEVEALLPAPLGDTPLEPRAVSGTDPAWLDRVVQTLTNLEQRAIERNDGGLRFLAVTLRCFLTEERIDPAEHPLVVALYVRTAARRDRRPDRPQDVARALDAW